MDISREILQFLYYHPLSSRDEIARGTGFEGSDATMKRLLAAAVAQGNVTVEGKARATRYRLSDQAHLLMPLNLDTYFAQDVDERKVQTAFNFDLIRHQLPAVRLFTDAGASVVYPSFFRREQAHSPHHQQCHSDSQRLLSTEFPFR